MIDFISRYGIFFKRAFDIVFSSLFLLTIFPAVYAVLGVVIKWDSPGPVFFVQERTGKGGRRFRCYKFRSMYPEGEETECRQATLGDRRVTRIGRFLRRTNMDELPQFMNVLKGEMSVVGPRPHPLWLDEEYEPLIKGYKRRYGVKPGITGWAQIMGYRGETRRVKEMEGRINRDIWYINHWSFGLDMRIVVRTAINMFRGDKKAY
jgi:putative colanic acid biosynthesis UDP-glucose lipid carrier transferase